MTNPKGTANETRAARWLNANGFPGAQRKAKSGNRDKGDLDLCPGIIVEVKAYRLPTGIPTDGQLRYWLAQAAAEKANAKARCCPLVVKRPGTTDVGRWFAYLPMADLALLTGAFLPTQLDEEPVMLTVAALTTVLRSCGYGTPLETAQEAS